MHRAPTYRASTLLIFICQMNDELLNSGKDREIFVRSFLYPKEIVTVIVKICNLFRENS